MTRQTVLKSFVAALSTRRRLRTPRSSLCHRCPAHRLVPSGRPRALGHARVRASPGIRVSRSGLRRAVQVSRAADNKKPSGALGSGGSTLIADCRPRAMRGRSHEPGTRYRSAGGRSIVGGIFQIRSASSGSCLIASDGAREGCGTYASSMSMSTTEMIATEKFSAACAASLCSRVCCRAQRSASAHLQTRVQRGRSARRAGARDRPPL
ncbi:hypothetical protein FBZ93_101495 [Bradyrhizobium macuxiense]|uniref:Uncharacterized protein n=1 Tax=Bradyrhizobium macuxiense TaxID=1755647 RepID=A0A560MIU2_9BRAD|nr:hypothetical protein FBZ93_101495 [Bradyrhizobium macuxiense]